MGSLRIVLLSIVIHLAVIVGEASQFGGGVLSDSDTNVALMPLKTEKVGVSTINYYNYSVGARARRRFPMIVNHRNLFPNIPVTYGKCSYTATNATVGFDVNLCDGSIITDGSCPTYFDVFPTDYGPFGFIETCDWVTEFGPGSLVIEWTGTIVRSEEVPACTEKKPGSEIDVDLQVVTERIPIVGTPFDYVYSSSHAEGYPSEFFRLNHNNFNPEVFTVSVHNFYMPEFGVLHKGAGGHEKLPHKVLSNGNLAVISSDGSEVYIFLSYGRHIQTLRSLTGAVKYTFNYSGNYLTSIVDDSGNSTVFNRTANVLTSIVAPGGQVTSIGGIAGDGILSVSMPGGQTYSMTYYDFELLKTFTKPGGQTTTFTYRNGKLIKDLGAAGNFWEIIGDRDNLANDLTLRTAMGREEIYSGMTVDPQGNYTRAKTNSAGELSTYTNGTSGISSIVRGDKTVSVGFVDDERFGNLSSRLSNKTTSVNSIARSVQYDQQVDYAPGVVPDMFNYTRIVKSATVGGNTTTSSFDKATLTWTTESPLGQVNTVVLDSKERPVSVQTGNDVPMTTLYSSSGFIASSQQGAKNRNEYRYNTAGLLAQIENQRGEVTSYKYDGAGRVSEIALPDGRTSKHEYDKNGNLTCITPPGRAPYFFEYALSESLSSSKAPYADGGVARTTLQYDLDNNLSKIVRPDGQEVNINYGSSTGLPLSAVMVSGTISFSYVPSSQKASSLSSSSSVGSNRLAFDYHGDTIKSVEQWDSILNVRYGRVSRAFDSAHRIASETLYGRSSTPVSTRSIVYDNDERPFQVGDMSLTYEPASGRLKTKSLNRISDSRTYDQYGFLISYEVIYTPLSGSPFVLMSYSLGRDEMSRIVSKSEVLKGVTTYYQYLYDSAGRLTSVNRNSQSYSSYVYDQNSNRVSGVASGLAFSSTFDVQDKLLTFNNRQYQYNANGELSSYEKSFTEARTLHHNARGQLTSIDLPSGTLSKEYAGDGTLIAIFKNGNLQSRYVYGAGKRLVAEVDGNGAVVKEYVYVTASNAADYMVHDSAKLFIVKDHLGSPRLVVNSETGEIVQAISYNEWGKVLVDTNSCYQPFGFAGGLVNADHDLVKFGARYYDPEIGRWTSKDPIGFAGGDTNLYGYVLADPINFVDYSGLCPCGNPQDVVDSALTDTLDWSKEADRTDLNSGFGSGKDKCNLFADHHYEKAGYSLPNVGGSIYSQMQSKYPPGAKNLSDPKFVLEGWPVVAGPAGPGDLLARDGHVAISTGNGQAASATGGGMVNNDWAYRQNTPAPVIRRCQCP